MDAIADLKTIAELGATGIAVFSLWINYKLVTNHESHFLAQHDTDTKVIQENTESNVKLLGVIDNLQTYLRERIK